MRLLKWVLVIGVCAAIAGGLGYYKYEQIQAAIARGKAYPEPVEAVQEVFARAVERQGGLDVSGVVVATRSAELRNELAGRIVNVGFAPGAPVHAGQLLLALDTSQERAQLAEAEANREIARLALNRAQRLVKSGAGSVEARDQANAQFEAASARASALAATIAKKSIVAPFAGIASLHQLEPGQYLAAGSVVASLIGVDEALWVDFALPQSHAGIREGTTVTIDANDLDLPPFNATVIARDPSVQESSRNLRLRARVDAPPTTLLPGMLVQVKVPLGESRSLVTVPAKAVRQDSLGASVYVLESVDENGQQRLRAQRRAVQVARSAAPDQQDWLVLEAGVTAGERIAASGAFKLRDGALVKVVDGSDGEADRVVGR
ncbi:MAG: efflux RND transporter periplasmic adaptor subunit [Pseudomonadales bacterium]|nr:efflux RND transporter periplasmic adaptor subunit [Pseudomonadales bacterium]MCP5185844.1 efflux RND transporter periplasmic adaptor subunit [Pseudomonadales bacterium]